MTYGNPFQGFLGGKYSEVIYHSLLLGAPWDCAVCLKPHRLALLGCTVENYSPNLWLCNQIANSLSYPASYCYHSILYLMSHTTQLVIIQRVG